MTLAGLASNWSLGRLADGLARTLGWSPIGRQIEFTSVEGPLESRLCGRTASVIALVGENLVVECSDETGESPLRLRLKPRHAGWTARSLMLAGIGVVAQVESARSGSEAAAIGFVRIAR